MALNKQAKILTSKQQELALSYLERTRYPLRNKIIFMLSYKAGLRAKEIANLSWLMVCDSEGHLSREINLINKASKGQGNPAGLFLCIKIWRFYWRNC